MEQNSTLTGYASILKNHNYVNNQWLSEGTGETLTVVDKYTQEPICQIPYATEAQMEMAISASVEGFNIYKKWSAGRRAAHMQKALDLLIERREAFEQLIVAEGGKPLSYARTEIARSIDTLKTAVNEAIRHDGEMVPMDYNNGEGKIAYTRRFPVGPIAAISPFNFPLNLAMHKIAPALATGCSIVLKPSPQAPLSTMAFAALVEEAGFPAGVFNVLIADIPVAQKLVEDGRMKMLSFTGSPGVGWYLKSIAGKKRVALELGGNAAVVVDEDADINRTAKTVAYGAYLYAGQICISTQRVFVHANIYDAFKEKLVEEVAKVKSGNPFLEDTVNGPVIDRGHLERIDSWVKEALEGGAELLNGGEILDLDANVYAPTLLTNTQKEMKVVYEEVFGPVAVLEKVDSFQQALHEVNDSQFGLQAGVYTNNLKHALLAHEELEVGGVIINNVPGYRIDNMPYGGVKESGLGREGILYTMEEMTEPRLIVM